MISVALCTYNGENFLRQQLESILKQSKPVDEIIICDDCSTDSTLTIIKNLQKEFPLVIKSYVNELSLGAIKNFEQAIGFCKGDIIFLSDQDDVWVENKVRIILDKFKANSFLEAIFSDANLMDNEGKPLNQTLFNKFYFDLELQKKWHTNQALIDLVYDRSRITGATVAIRKELFERSFPTTLNHTIWHDAYLGMNAAANNGLGWIAEPLINYRIHDAQQVGIGNGTTVKTKTYDNLKSHLENFKTFYLNRLILADQLLDKYPLINKEELKKEGVDWLRYCELRLNMPKKFYSRLSIILSNSLLYKSHSNFFLRSMLKDLLNPCK